MVPRYNVFCILYIRPYEGKKTVSRATNLFVYYTIQNCHVSALYMMFSHGSKLT